MASMTTNMWNYNFIEDLDVCLNPYGKESYHKDAYGDYSIDNSNHKKKKKKTNNKFNTNHKHYLDMIGIWDISKYTGVAGEYAVAQIVNILTNINTVIPQYQVKILDGKHKDKILTVFENEAIEEIDPTPYLPDEYLPDEYKLNKSNKTPNDFKCDIEELKTDISDLRTNINDLMRDHTDLRGDILAIKPSGDIMLDNDSDCTISSFAHELENKVYDIKDLVDHEVSDIKEHIELQEAEIKKISKVSKLSLLNSINNWIV